MKAESLDRLLKGHALLADMTEDQIRFVTGCAKNVRYRAGEYLFREGSPADELFLVRRGKVALEVHVPGRGPAAIESVGPDDVLGWSTLFPPFRWHVDGRALEDTIAIVLDGKCLRDKVEADHEFGFVFVKRLLYEISRRLHRTRLQQVDVYRAAE